MADVLTFRRGARILCDSCERPMARVENGWECQFEGCGSGYLRAEHGIKVRVEGNTTILESDGVE